MKRNLSSPFIFVAALVILISLACSLPMLRTEPETVVQVIQITATPLPNVARPPQGIPPTATPQIVHIANPSAPPRQGALVYDVECSGTAAEKRAPYGDAYDINRLERPFQQDMTYIPDLDIVTYNLSQDDTWIYVSIQLIGTDPNNPLGIHYGVEIDDDADGFGDLIIWAGPPYTPVWEASNVQVFADRNHDTGGLSGEKSDAPLDGDGYETVLFDHGIGEDPDMAWVRVNAGAYETVQFAFKRSLTDGAYMLGVLADAGLKDPGKLDYVDRFTEAEAGSPEKSEQEYPLKALYAVDNACREAYGFEPTGYEPQLCPREPTPEPGHPRPTTPPTCQPPPYCTGPHYIWHGEPDCWCEAIPW